MVLRGAFDDSVLGQLNWSVGGYEISSFPTQWIECLAYKTRHSSIALMAEDIVGLLS